MVPNPKEDLKIKEPSVEALDKEFKESQEKGYFLSEFKLRNKITKIRKVIRDEEKKLRQKYPILNHQNLLGLGCFIISFLAVLLTGYLYLKKTVSAWLTVPLMALPLSILHELEHDIIHNMYFKSKEWVQHLMFFVIWIVKLSVNPWLRKEFHLRHHQESGSEKDIEERFIGLGKPLNWFRVFVMSYHPASVLLVREIDKDNKDFGNLTLKIFTLNGLNASLYIILWHTFFGFCRLHMGWTFTQYDPVLYLPLWLWPWVRDAAVLLLLPNVLRQASLNLIASYCHYYEIPQNNVFYQNQILDHWIFAPFNFFSFNFGQTHILHHFVTNQPFYIRQMISNKALPTLEENGIRRNDLNIFKNNNRYFDNETMEKLRKEDKIYSLEQTKVQAGH